MCRSTSLSSFVASMSRHLLLVCLFVAAIQAVYCSTLPTTTVPVGIANQKQQSSTQTLSTSLSWTEKVGDALRDLPDVWGEDDVDPDQVDSSQNNSDEEIEIDESLYSRQLFVYGKSAQRKLMMSHVAILGDDALAEEVVKNLALAGVGKISLIRSNTTSTRSSNPSMLGEAKCLEEYIHDLNRQIEVEVISLHNDSISSFESLSMDASTVDLLVATNQHIDRLIDLNKFTRLRNIKMSIGATIGACGYVFNDFLQQHEISDIDGEVYKEVSLGVRLK